MLSPCLCVSVRAPVFAGFMNIFLSRRPGEHRERIAHETNVPVRDKSPGSGAQIDERMNNLARAHAIHEVVHIVESPQMRDETPPFDVGRGQLT